MQFYLNSYGLIIKMTDIMVDLETLSVRPHAAIVIIGAIKFNRFETWEKNINDEDLKKLDVFYRRIKIDSCKDIGLHVDEINKEWWKEQDPEIQFEALENPDRVTLQVALEEFKEWFGTDTHVKIWGNGSGFDCSVLGEAYTRCGIEKPWKFWMERDLRTIMDLANLFSGNLPKYKKHHALWDCYRQIIGFQMCEKLLQL